MAFSYILKHTYYTRFTWNLQLITFFLILYTGIHILYIFVLQTYENAMLHSWSNAIQVQSIDP